MSSKCTSKFLKRGLKKTFQNQNRHLKHSIKVVKNLSNVCFIFFLQSALICIFAPKIPKKSKMRKLQKWDLEVGPTQRELWYNRRIFAFLNLKQPKRPKYGSLKNATQNCLGPTQHHSFLFFDRDRKHPSMRSDKIAQKSPNNLS